MTTTDPAPSQRYKRTPPKDRGKLMRDAVRQYKKGASIRAIADGMGRSYGLAHALLTEARDAGLVELRGQGGARTRRPKGKG